MRRWWGSAANVMGRGWEEEERDRDSQRDLTFKDIYPILNDRLPSARILLKSPSLVFVCVLV